MKAVLGLKLDPWHDTGAAVVADRFGKLHVSAISQERLDRKKNSRTFPLAAINYCLNETGCQLKDISLIVADFIFTPGIDDVAPNEKDSQFNTKLEFFKRAEALGIPVIFAEHHLCHAASAYFSTDWKDALGMVVDGLGSYYETQTFFNCEGRSITKIASSHQPGLGWMYSTATELLLGFGHLQEGKTMGLAGFATSGGSWQKSFEAHHIFENPVETSYPQFLRVPPNTIWRMHVEPDFPRRQQGQDPIKAPFAEYAYAAQEELERGIVKLASYAKKISSKKRLCYAGGVALNILANRKLLDSGLFEDIFIQPAASDSGIPLGAALLGYYTVLGGTKRWKMESAFLSHKYSNEEISASVKKWTGEKTPYKSEILAKVLKNNYLVAWSWGSSEFGPRALGHRSILCYPRHPKMKAYLNAEVKHREMFRPFAPIVPIENQSEYFDLKSPSPYMLINAKVHPQKASLIPAVVHADGTARVQSVDYKTNPELYELLNKVGKLTGVPILLNTSLNLAGEPIAETPTDVVDLFSRSRLDALVIGSTFLSKRPLNELLNQTNPGLENIEAPAPVMA